MVKYFCDRCEKEYSQTGKQTTMENMIEAFLKNKDKEKELKNAED